MDNGYFMADDNVSRESCMARSDMVELAWPAESQELKKDRTFPSPFCFTSPTAPSMVNGDRGRKSVAYVYLGRQLLQQQNSL